MNKSDAGIGLLNCRLYLCEFYLGEHCTVWFLNTIVSGHWVQVLVINLLSTVIEHWVLVLLISDWITFNSTVLVLFENTSKNVHVTIFSFTSNWHSVFTGKKFFIQDENF